MFQKCWTFYCGSLYMFITTSIRVTDSCFNANKTDCCSQSAKYVTGSLAARCCCRPRFCCTIHNSIYPVPDGKLLLTNTHQQKGDTKSPSSPAKLRRLILLVSRFPTNNICFMIPPALILHESQKYDLWPDYARLYSCPGEVVLASRRS